MSNSDPERLPEDGAPGEAEAPTRVRKTRAVKRKTTKKRAAKAAVTKTPAENAAAKSTAITRSKPTTSGYRRVRVGNSEMFVSREMADALTNKDTKRLEAVFKRVLKRARKRAGKQKR